LDVAGACWTQFGNSSLFCFPGQTGSHGDAFEAPPMG